MNLRNKFDFITCGDMVTPFVEEPNIFDQMLFPLKPGGIVVMTA